MQKQNSSSTYSMLEKQVLEGMKCRISHALMRAQEAFDLILFEMGFKEKNVYVGTLAFKTDPVITADGYSYEREEIEAWFSTGSRISPATGLPLLSLSIIPNHNLRKAIDEIVFRFPLLEELRTPERLHRQRSFPLRNLDATPYASIKFLSKLGFFGKDIAFNAYKNEAWQIAIPEKNVDALVFIEEPLRNTTEEMPSFTFRVKDVTTHFSGPVIGITDEDPQEWKRELVYLIEDSSWYVDGSGWAHSPGNNHKSIDWSSSMLKKNTEVCVCASVNGHFRVFVNGSLVVDFNCQVPVDSFKNFWGFICITGCLKHVELLGIHSR